MRFVNVKPVWLVAAIVALVSAVSVGLAVAGETVTTSGKGKPAVYVGKTVGSQVLGKHGEPAKVIVNTSALPAGKYLVDYSVEVSMGPEERVTCAASATIDGNQGTFGTVSNPASGTGEGPSGTLGNASDTETIEVKAGGKIYVMCDKWGPHGTESVGAVVTAQKVGAETIDNQ